MAIKRTRLEFQDRTTDKDKHHHELQDRNGHVKSQGDMTVDMYTTSNEDNNSAQQQQQQFKKQKISNMKTVTIVTTTVQRIVAVVTTTKTTKICTFDDKTSYYTTTTTSTSTSTSTRAHPQGCSCSDEKIDENESKEDEEEEQPQQRPQLIKVLSSRGTIEEEAIDQSIVAEVENETTTETRTVVEETVRECDSSSLFDELTVAVIDDTTTDNSVAKQQ